MEVRKYLDFYRKQGLCIIPIPFKSKKATISWKEYQGRLPTDLEIQQWFGGDNTNIALVCGTISQGLVALDCDSEEVFYKLGATIKEKTGVDDVLDYTLVSQTGRGYQYLLRTKEPVKSQKFPQLDIKAEGGYIIVPPSIHPNGKQYKFLNPNIPIKLIDSLKDIGIDLEQKTELSPKEPNWISELLKGVAEGQRNDSCARLAGYFATTVPQNVAETILLNWNTHNSPPLPEKEILATIISIFGKEIATPGVYKNTLFYNAPDMGNLALNRDNSVTTSVQDGVEWGTYAKKFDEVLALEGGRCDKREVAVTIGLQVTSDAFRQILSRRKREGKVRAYRGSHNLIEWVNRDYSVTRPDKLATIKMLDIRLPFKIDDLARIPPRSINGAAGETSSGKTSLLLELAELNVFTQPLPVYYWYNEMSEAKMVLRWEDYPLLNKALKEGKFFPVMQTNFEFYDVLEPEAINIIDYIDRNDEFYLISDDLRKLYNNLTTGVVFFGLQKHPQQALGYGGVMSVKLSNFYITLSKVEEAEVGLKGKAKIIKCKDWANEKRNPCGLFCNYHTGGKHGKLLLDGEWQRGLSK